MEQQNNAEWEAPPPPEAPVAEPEKPEMSEVGTLANIFIEPGKTFENLRRKPRFIMAAIIMALAVGAFVIMFNAQMGEDRIRRFAAEQMDKSPGADSMPPAQRNGMIELNVTIAKYISYAVPIFVLIGFILGGLLYWVSSKAFGSSISFLGAVAVFVYASFPQGLVSLLLNTVVLFIKNPDDIEMAASQRGIVQANLAFFIDQKAMPVLATILSTIDLFQIWGWILAAIGLRVVGKMSKGSAWTIVLIWVAVMLAFRVISSVMSGNPA